MYLNRLKIESVKFIDNVLLWIAAFFLLFDLPAFVVTFTQYRGDRGMQIIGFILGVIFFLIPVGIICGAVSSKRRLVRAEVYNRIFEEDHDGMVSYTNFCKLTGFSASQVRSDISSMYHKKIFKNITYGIEGAMIIMKADTSGDFINVDCPNCGAVVTMRSNGGARCAHCGTYLRSES